MTVILKWSMVLYRYSKVQVASFLSRSDIDEINSIWEVGIRRTASMTSI